MDDNEPNTHIYILDNVVSNTVCDELITFINTSAKMEETVDNGSNVLGSCCFPNGMGSENGADKITEKVYEVVSKITHKLMDIFPISVSAFTPFQLRKIHGATKIHIDGLFRRELMDERGFLTPNDMRELTLIIGLNDDYEGGELHFPEQKITTKLKKGQAIAFPPYWTHPHYTNDLSNNTTRYTITTWLMK